MRPLVVAWCLAWIASAACSAPPAKDGWAEPPTELPAIVARRRGPNKAIIGVRDEPPRLAVIRRDERGHFDPAHWLLTWKVRRNHCFYYVDAGTSDVVWWDSDLSGGPGCP